MEIKENKILGLHDLQLNFFYCNFQISINTFYLEIQ